MLPKIAEPKRRTQKPMASPTPLQPDDAYWERFIQHRFGNLKTTVATPPTKEEAKVLSDPLFPKFLELLSADWGQGPGSINNFLKLPQDEKLFYLGAFQIWKENIQKKGIKIQV